MPTFQLSMIAKLLNQIRFAQPGFDFCHSFADAVGGVEKARENAVLVIAASIIAVIRLRGQDIKPSPKLVSTVRDSVDLARLVLAEVEGRG